LLRKLGIEANPILLSTRSNGLLPKYSSFDKFNYVAVQAVIGENSYLLDATEEYLPIGILPERALNKTGFLLIKDKFNWVDLTPIKKEKEYSLLQFQLTDDVTLKGDWITIKSDYAALQARKNFKKYNSIDDYLKSIEDNHLGLSIENSKMDDFDSIHKPLKEVFSIVLKNQVTKVNNQIFINPIPFDRWTENPFKLETRNYPVDFVTPIDKTFLFQLEIPQGYALEQLPKNLKMNLKENTATFQLMSSLNENKVQVLFKFNITKPVFPVTEYLDLKAFFDELVKKQSEMIILKKI